MDYFDLSLKSKKRLTRWMSKRYRELSIAELIRNARDERQLFAMCRYIDRWYDEHEPYLKPIKASMELSEDQETSTPDLEENIEPETFRTIQPESTVKPQKEISKRTKGRINEFILNHPGAPISEIVSSAADEAELLKAIEEMENKVVPVDIRVRLWTCRRL